MTQKTDKGVNASAAAIKPPTAETITFTHVGTYLYAQRDNPSTNIAYGTDTVVSASGAGATISGKTVSVTKEKGVNYTIGYIAFKSEIKVPAMTEYEIDYKADLKLIKYRNGGSSANTWCQLLYFDNSDNGGADRSSSLSFLPDAASMAYGVGSPIIAHHLDANGNKVSSGATVTLSDSVSIPTITYTNNTDEIKTYTAYFGFVGIARQANDSTSANGITATADFSKSTIKLNTEIKDTPDVDSSTKEYNGEDQEFTFTYDNKRVSVTKWEFTNKKDVLETKTGDPLDSDGKMKAKDAGTYKLYFNIKDKCGAVWNLTTKDQTEKTASFTITSKKLTAPSGTVEAIYTGNDLTVNNAKTVPTWYDNLIYTDPKIMTVTPDKVIDANESGYTVTATIVSGGHLWSDSASNSSDSRTFTFKVNKKALEVEFEEKNGLQVAKFKDESQIASRDGGDKYPKLVTKYYEASGSPNNLKDAPTSLGDWVAVAVLENADTCNYSVSGTKSFTSTKTQVAYPKLSASSSASEEYSGEDHEFTYEGYDSATMNKPDVPTGATSFDGTTLKAKNAGKYKPVFTLKDTDLYEWSGTAPGEVEITAKPIVIDADDENKTEWEKGTATTLKFNIPTQLCDGDTTVDLVATYTLNGGEEHSCTVSVDGKTGTVTIGKGFAKGDYVLTVKTAEGANYSGTCTQSFSVTAKGLSLGSNDIKWTIDGKTFVTADYDDAVFEMEYTGTPLTLQNVKVNFSSASDAPYLEQDGDLTGDFIGAVDVGEYSATFAVKPKSSDETCSDGPFTLTIKIVPKKLDFSKPEWEYTDDSGATWKKLSATNKPSYTGDPISIRISPDYMKGLGLDLDNGDYTANYNPLNDPIEQGQKTTKVGLTVNNGNYTTADESGYVMLTCNWEIAPKALPYKWKDNAQTVEAGENAFEFPAIAFDDGQDYSQYYDYVYTVDGVDGKEYTLDELKEYIAENWSETSAVTGKVGVRMKDGVTTVTILPSSRPFTTGTPKTALTVEVTGSGAEYGLVNFALGVVKNGTDERARTTVEISGGALAEAKSFDGNASELVAFVNGLDVGEYTITVSLKTGNEDFYVLTKSVFNFEVLIRKVIVPQVVGEITYNGAYINVVDYLDGNYNADIMSILSGKENKTAGSYTVTFKLVNDNYTWVEPTGAEPMSKLFAKAMFTNEISINNPELTATLGWTINKIVLATDGWNLKSKTGVSLNALAAYQEMITANSLDVSIGYRYYDTNGNFIEEPVLKGGDKYVVEAYLIGEDAVNFEFEDGTDELKSISARKDYAVPQSAAAAFFGSVAGFAKANWLWLVIAAVALLFLIILICIIVSAKKKKRRREELEEQRRREEKEERERKEEERREREEQRRREEREERMARMSQAQMPQYMPQPMPQYAPQPQYMPQSTPQNAQAAPAGGSVDNAQITRIETELAAMKAAQAARDLAEIKAAQAAMHDDINELKRGDQISGINVDAMTEIMTMALKNVLASATQQAVAAQPAQPAQLTDGGAPAATANAVTQIPPDAVMTTVTTTKIDTTKKPAQAGERAAAPAGRTVVRNFVAPMPVDDGRVFDVGGFYKPADPVTDMGFGEEEKKDV